VSEEGGGTCGGQGWGIGRGDGPRGQPHLLCGVVVAPQQTGHACSAAVVAHPCGPGAAGDLAGDESEDFATFDVGAQVPGCVVEAPALERLQELVHSG
jgi:hypothetical protein